MRSTTIQELRDLSKLHGENAPNKKFKDALHFLEKKPYHVPIPNAQICHDGSIGFYWRSDIGPLHAEIIFEGNGTCYSFGAYGKDADADIYTERGIDVDAEWPQGLRKILDYSIGEN